MTSYIFNLSAVFFKNFFINFYYYIWKVFPIFTIVSEGTLGLTSQYLKNTNLSTVFSPCSFNLILSGSLYFMKTNATLHPLSLHPWKIRSFHFKPRLLSSRNLVEHILNKIDKSAEKLRSCKLNTKTELTGEYIAGLVQADGSFSAVLCRRTKQNNHRYRIDLKFGGRSFSHKSSLSSLMEGLLETKLARGQDTNRVLTGEFVAGLVTSYGVFSAVLVRRKTKNNYHYRIDCKFTLTVKFAYKYLILELQNKLNNKGNWIYQVKDKTIKYQVTVIKDLLNVVIPFFMKYHIRGDKLKSFLRFKYVLEVVSSKVHFKNKDIFLSLLVIAAKLNPMAKLGTKIRYLNPEQQYFVINNIQPEGVDISKLTESIANFKQNPLSLDFVKGLLLPSNTNNLSNVSEEDQNYIKEKFGLNLNKKSLKSLKVDGVKWSGKI